MVHKLEVRDVFPVNTFFYIDDKTNAGFVIDPGAEPEMIYNVILENKWEIEQILLTHGHMDHIGAVAFLQEKLHIPALIHADEEEFLKDGYLNLSDNFGPTITVDDYDIFKNQDVIRLKANPGFYLKVIHTPGHTPGSSVFYSPENHLAFIGDDLFEHGLGLTHFPGGDKEKLETSIRNILLKLPEDTVLYSSHAAPITLAEQKKLLPL